MLQSWTKVQDVPFACVCSELRGQGLSEPDHAAPFIFDAMSAADCSRPEDHECSRTLVDAKRTAVVDGTHCWVDRSRCTALVDTTPPCYSASAQPQKYYMPSCLVFKGTFASSSQAGAPPFPILKRSAVRLASNSLPAARTNQKTA